MSLTHQVISRAFKARQLRGEILRCPFSGDVIADPRQIVILGVSSCRSDVDGYLTVSFPLILSALQKVGDPNAERLAESRIRSKPCEYVLCLSGHPESPVKFAAAEASEWMLGRTKRLTAQGYQASARVLCGVSGDEIASAAELAFVGCAVEAVQDREVCIRTFAVSDLGVQILLNDPDALLAVESRLSDPNFEFSLGRVWHVQPVCPSASKPCGGKS